MRKWLYIGLAFAAVMAWRDWSTRPIEHPPGVLVPDIPRQVMLANPVPEAFGEYRLTRRAAFSLKARVLSREDYWLDDGADLSPVDLALGWGVMSDQAVLDRIDIHQGARWYFTRYDLPAPITDAAIINHSSNMHMVPANDWVHGKLKELRHGDLVFLKGHLVDIEHDSGFRWNSSLRRDDTGDGSCELFYLEEVYIDPRP